MKVNRVGVHERRGDEAEVGHGRLQLLNKIEPPAFLARCDVETDEQVAHARHEHTLAIQRRRGANPIAVRLGEEGHAQRAFPLDSPELFSGLAIQRRDHLELLVLRLGRENAIRGHNRAGVTRVKFDSPELLEMVGVEFVWPRWASELSVAVRAAPLRPGGLGRCFGEGGDSEGKSKEQGFHGIEIGMRSAGWRLAWLPSVVCADSIAVEIVFKAAACAGLRTRARISPVGETTRTTTSF